jgi:hypothetical protein
MELSAFLRWKRREAAFSTKVGSCSMATFSRAPFTNLGSEDDQKGVRGELEGRSENRGFLLVTFNFLGEVPDCQRKQSQGPMGDGLIDIINQFQVSERIRKEFWECGGNILGEKEKGAEKKNVAQTRERGESKQGTNLEENQGSLTAGDICITVLGLPIINQLKEGLYCGFGDHPVEQSSGEDLVNLFGFLLQLGQKLRLRKARGNQERRLSGKHRG